MDKYNNSGMWNKDGLQGNNCWKSEFYYVNVPDLKSYKVPLKKCHSQSIGKRKGKHQSLLRVKKLDGLKKRELLTKVENYIHKNFVQQDLVTNPTLSYSNDASNLSVKHPKRQPMSYLNMNCNQNIEKLLTPENSTVFNQNPNHCCNQNRLETNLNSMSTKSKMIMCRTEENDILKQQLYQEDGFQQNASRNVVINLHCWHENLGITLNIYGCEDESGGTIDQELATELTNYEFLRDSKCYENGKRHPSCDYQQKCYFH